MIRDDYTERDDDGKTQRELNALEARLAALVPRPDRLNRERLIFLAGRASLEGDLKMPHVEQRVAARWAWPASFAAMTAIAAMLLVMLIVRGENETSESMMTRTLAADRSNAADERQASSQTQRSFTRPEIDRARNDVLSTGDLLRVDAELLVTARDGKILPARARNGDQEVAPANLDPKVTPTSWRLLNELLPPYESDKRSQRTLESGVVT